MARPCYTVASSDVGRPVIHAFGRVMMVSGFLGRVLPGDVGKRIFLSGDVPQVESDRQRDERLAKPASPPPAAPPAKTHWLCPFCGITVTPATAPPHARQCPVT
jgi:hypothetical protein